MVAITTVQPREDGLAFPERPSRLPSLPWRDPHSVPAEELAKFIASLSDACVQNPDNADLRTCLGIAHAMNYDVYRSLDALEEARLIAPDNFFAQLKFSELLYRIRVVDRAEVETLRALQMANNAWELSLARRQLAEIRKIKRKGLIRPVWTQSPMSTIIGLLLLLAGATCMFMVLK
jgi:hypothetical protein